MDPRRHRLLEVLAKQTLAPHAPQELAALLVLMHLHARHGAHWLSGPRDRSSAAVLPTEGALLTTLAQLKMEIPPRRRPHLAKLHSLVELWRSYFFRGVVLDSHEGQLGWMQNRYPLTARFDIPSAEEMLALQCQGGRFVTLLIQPSEQFLRYGRHADACAFLLHDFEHAHKFFADPDSHRGQVRFFRALRSSLAKLDRWRADLRFTQDLEYLMSDMNSHPVHLLKFLKAVVLAAEIRLCGDPQPPLDDFWLTLFSDWGMADELLDACLRLNQPALESVSEQRLVADFFMAPNSVQYSYN